MKVVYKRLPPRRGCVATIGVFDGLHLGHQFILKKLKEVAAKRKVPCLVITFDYPPKKLLNKHFLGLITSLEEKKSLISSLGIDYLWILKTRHSLLQLSGEEFIGFIVKYFCIKELVVGEDFCFGYKGETDVKCLMSFGSRFGFDLRVLKKKRKRGKIISSSLIREFIVRGRIREAKEILGRNYALRGRVIKGGGLGKKLGFPTANILPFGYIIPRCGIYAGLVEMGRTVYPAAINIGIRPTVSKAKKIILEAHIVDFSRNILGKEIKIFFLEKIREEKKFPTLEKLRQAISKDIVRIRSYRHPY